MTKTTSLVDARPRRQAASNVSSRVRAELEKHAGLPVKPLMIGVGIGAALLGTVLAVRAKKPVLAGFANVSPELSSTLTQTALVALARVVSGQTMRNVASSTLLEVANALKR